MVSEHVDQERNRRCRRPAGRRRGVEALSASAASRRARGGYRDRGGRPGAASWRGRGRRRRLAPGTETPIRRCGCLRRDGFDVEGIARGYYLGVGGRSACGSACRRRPVVPLAASACGRWPTRRDLGSSYAERLARAAAISELPRRVALSKKRAWEVHGRGERSRADAPRSARDRVSLRRARRCFEDRVGRSRERSHVLRLGSFVFYLIISVSLLETRRVPMACFASVLQDLALPNFSQSA